MFFQECRQTQGQIKLEASTQIVSCLLQVESEEKNHSQNPFEEEILIKIIE